MAEPGGPTPLSLARAMRDAGEAPEGSPADLVLEADKPWSRETHKLFPQTARERAAMLLRLGWLLSRSGQFLREEEAMFNVWVDVMIPQAVFRD